MHQAGQIPSIPVSRINIGGSARAMAAEGTAGSDNGGVDAYVQAQLASKADQIALHETVERLHCLEKEVARELSLRALGCDLTRLDREVTLRATTADLVVTNGLVQGIQQGVAGLVQTVTNHGGLLEGSRVHIMEINKRDLTLAGQFCQATQQFNQVVPQVLSYLVPDQQGVVSNANLVAAIKTLLQGTQTFTAIGATWQNVVNASLRP